MALSTTPKRRVFGIEIEADATVLASSDIDLTDKWAVLWFLVIELGMRTVDARERYVAIIRRAEEIRNPPMSHWQAFSRALRRVMVPL